MASSRTFTTSPLMFESEDEDTTYFDEHTQTRDIKDDEEKQGETSIPVVNEPKKEERLLKKFQTVLMGIPPPPAFTVPQLDVREILMLWKDNQKYRVVLSPGKVSGKKEEAAVLENKIKSTKWPEALNVDNWDIYYNRSSSCEEMERLSIRYKDRYVGAETSSCVNALFAKSPSRTASARKRARTRAWGHSPGRRLSHLARRRKAFSYCSVAGNNNPDKKMIMVEIKKMSNRQKKRNSAKKTKPTPNKKSQLQLDTHKRALFQSPDQLPAANETKTPNAQCIQRSKRNLFVETSSDKINENGKRERTSVKTVSPRKRVNRSLSFQDNTPLPTNRREVPGPSSSSAQALKTILSGAHKQKMLWAVMNALREEGMGMNHELFRPCMSVLFKACQKLWLTKVARLAQEGSTSENMLALAKQFTTYTINQISLDPTAEHMVLVCGNIMKMAERQSKYEAQALSSGKCVVNEVKSIKSSPVRPHESSEQHGSEVEKMCSLEEDSVISRSTGSTFNMSSPKHCKQNSTEKMFQKTNTPIKLNSSSKIKCKELKILLTPLGKSKDPKSSSSSQDTKVDSRVCQKSQELCRVSRSISGEFFEVSVTKDSINNSCGSVKENKWIVSTSVKSNVVCEEGNEELTKVEESSDSIKDSNQIVFTPSKNIGKPRTPNKDLTNVLSQVIRRKSNELMEVNSKLGQCSVVSFVTKTNPNNICESPKSNKLIVNKIDQSIVVCHEEPSNMEESNGQIMNSTWICTPSKKNVKTNTPNKDSPNSFSRVTRRKPNGLIELSPVHSKFCEVLSATKMNANNISKSPKANKLIVNTIDQSTVVSHEEPSNMEESNEKIMDSQICTPSKKNAKTNTLNKDSPNAFSRVTRRKSNELMEISPVQSKCCEVLSATKMKANNISKSPKANKLIVNKIDESTVVCHKEPSNMEGSNAKIKDSTQICTPSKKNAKTNTLNKDSPNAFSRVTRRKSNGLIELSPVHSKCCEVLSATKMKANNISKSPKAKKLVVSTSTVEQSPFVCHQGQEDPRKMEETNAIIMGSSQLCSPSKSKGQDNACRRVTRLKSSELIESKSIIKSTITNKILLKSDDENNTEIQSSNENHMESNKSSFKKRRKSKSSKGNMLRANETGSSSQSLDYVETTHISSNSTLLESVSPVKVPEKCHKDTTPNTLTTTIVCTANDDSESCIQPLTSSFCKPLARPLRSDSKDSPLKSIVLNGNETAYDCVGSNENKTAKSTKPKRRNSISTATKELSPQKSKFLESKCTDMIKSPLASDFTDAEKPLSQDCTDSVLDNRQDCEKNKENIENQVLAKICCSEKKMNESNTCTNPVRGLPVLTPASEMMPGGSFNRTLQMYRLTTQGNEDVESLLVFPKPPRLTPHWEFQPQQRETIRCTDSPPSLIPHWEQAEGSSSNSLPESIMAHWQQMSSNVSTSDKIMFDFEDTSYEITFSPNNTAAPEDSTASSVCAPFEFPHLIDESKSGFNTICRKNSSEW